MKRPTIHRFKLSKRITPAGRTLSFSCPCGFSVMQEPPSVLEIVDTYPHAFVKAVNEHLKVFATEDAIRMMRVLTGGLR